MVAITNFLPSEQSTGCDSDQPTPGRAHARCLSGSTETSGRHLLPRLRTLRPRTLKSR